MKNALFFWIFLLVAYSQLPARDYQTVYSDRVAIFDGGYSFYGMKMDSVKIEGNDSIFYPLKRIGEMADGCFTPYKSSWLGEKIIISENWNIFVDNNDSVRIKTDARVDESWVCYSNQDYTITANVTVHEIQSFLSVEDSVKIITFQAVDKENSTIEHLWNDKTIQISKNYGIIHGFDFTVLFEEETDYHYYYPLEYKLAGLDKPTIGIQNLTWREVWDFQPGDVIHILERDLFYMGQTENKNIITYLEREETEDKIRYKIFIQEDYCRRMYGVESASSLAYETTVEYTLQNEVFDKLPGEVIMENNVASTNVMFYSYDGFLFKRTDDDIDAAIMFTDDEQCWHKERNIAWDVCLGIFNYAKGLGGAYYSRPYCGYQHELSESVPVYYKKGNTEWGTPLILKAGVNELKTNTPQVIYNKSTDSFLINYDSNTSSCSFELMDSKGQLLIRQKITSSPYSIPAGKFPQGLYIYRLVESGGSVYSGKIVK